MRLDEAWHESSACSCTAKKSHFNPDSPDSIERHVHKLLSKHACANVLCFTKVHIGVCEQTYNAAVQKKKVYVKLRLNYV